MTRKRGIAGRVTLELIRAQALALRGTATISERRAAELAADISRLNDAVTQERRRLDFNDEPARFIALLTQVAGSSGKSK